MRIRNTALILQLSERGVIVIFSFCWAFEKGYQSVRNPGFVLIWKCAEFSQIFCVYLGFFLKMYLSICAIQGGFVHPGEFASSG
jgi:hypothetical protein